MERERSPGWLGSLGFIGGMCGQALRSVMLPERKKPEPERAGMCDCTYWSAG